MIPINQNEIVDSTAEYVLVVESYYTVSGQIGCILQCDNGILNDGTTLSDDGGRVWIIQNNLILPNNPVITVQELEERNWFHYRPSSSLNELVKPNINTKLKVKSINN